MEGKEIYFGFGLNMSKRKMIECGMKFVLCESVVFWGYWVEFIIWKDDGYGYVNIV